jgi:hypothetical protein
MAHNLLNGLKSGTVQLGLGLTHFRLGHAHIRIVAQRLGDQLFQLRRLFLLGRLLGIDHRRVHLPHRCADQHEERGQSDPPSYCPHCGPPFHERS